MKLEVDPAGTQLHITFDADDATFAQWFLHIAIAETDKAVRDAEQRRYQDFINYSRNRLLQENNVAYHDALTDAVRQYEISYMYSEAGKNFSFQYVEEPYLPINHSAPRPLTYTIFATIFALLMACCTVFAMMLWPQASFSRVVNRALGYYTPRFSKRPGSEASATEI